MCEIFCFNSNKPKQVNECLECFYNHSDEHPHGWGLANLKSDEFVIEKEPVKASFSTHLREILSNPIIGKNVFAHIRFATVGEIISPNCHPFIRADDSSRSWMLIHNGTIFDYPELEKYREYEKGDTDSERILLYIIDRVNQFEKDKGALSTIRERFNLLSEIIADMSKDNKLNLMISDGDMTYIHSNMDGSLYYLINDDGILIASTPVNDDENWLKVEMNKLFGLIAGQIVFESEPHQNEFIFTEKHEKIMEECLKSINSDLDD